MRRPSTRRVLLWTKISLKEWNKMKQERLRSKSKLKGKLCVQGRLKSKKRQIKVITNQWSRIKSRLRNHNF